MADPPDRHSTPSLVERIRAASGFGGDDRRLGLAIAALIGAAPLLTWGGARVMTARTSADRQAIERANAPALAAARARQAARREFAALLSRPGAATTLDALARALPRDAALVSADRDSAGRLRIEASSPDPDRLRAALRRVPETAELRDTGQRRGDGAMIVAMSDRR